MTQSLWVVIPAGVILIVFIVFAFLQGMKVTNKQEGTPPEETGTYGSRSDL